jgi:DNA (cytosine-5)-methyltransferase 1
LDGAKPQVVIGGPPCQGFSSIRPFRNLNNDDHRNNLFERFALTVDAVRPDWFVMENVVGLLTHQRGETLQAILNLFRQVGYTVSWSVLNAASYGLPQRRERLIVVGNRRGKSFRWPEPTHYVNGHRSMAGRKFGQSTNGPTLFNSDALLPATTVMDAINDLPILRSGETATEYRNDVEPTAYQREMRGSETSLTMHEATKHSDKMLEIIRHAGHNRHALPKGLTTSGFSSSYSRLEPDRPSVTLTVNFVHPASNKCIHPYQDRALTPREGARLQGFPDVFRFVGSRAQIVKQIGNAVPPLLGQVIALGLLKSE